MTLFQAEGIGLPPEVVAQIRQSPMFPALEAIAQSVVYDATITAAFATPDPGLMSVDVPTLVLNGEQTWPRLAQAARSLAEALPRARYQQVPGGAEHGIPAGATADVMRIFLTETH